MFNTDVITLTSEEELVGNVSITLKEIADRFGKLNKNLVRDLEAMLKDLSVTQSNQLKFEPVEYADKKGEIRKTYSTNLRGMVWFISKFKHALRADVVNYAFNKLEQEQSELQKVIEVKEKEVRVLAEKLKQRPIRTTNTSMTNRKARHDELMSLVRNGILTYEKKIVTTYDYTITEKGIGLGYYKFKGVVIDGGNFNGI
jgi:hypothetical protein